MNQLSPSYTLYIETSSKTCSVALALDSQIIGSRYSESEFKHSKEAALFVRDLLHEARIKTNQIAEIYLSKGPGSYTGLRIGYSLVQGLAFPEMIPIIEVSTLQALAAQAKFLKKSEIVKNYIVFYEARKDEFFVCIYNADLNQVQDIQVLSTNELLQFVQSFNSDPKLLVTNKSIDKNHLMSQSLNEAELLVTEINALNLFRYNNFTKNLEEFGQTPFSCSPDYIKQPFITKQRKGIINSSKIGNV